MRPEPAPEPTDDELLAQATRTAGTPEARQAASRLLGRYQRRVYAWCYRYVHDPDRALDLAQETLMNAYRSMHTFQGRSQFSSWLFVIARNRCFSAVRAPSPLLDDVELDTLPGVSADPALTYERQVDEGELRDLIARHLDEDEREALWMRCFERLPVDEITRRLGLGSASGARGLLQRARRHLRAALATRAPGREP